VNARQAVRDAEPSPHFAKPPYKAELLGGPYEWAGVVNANGVNVLNFRSKPGAVVSSIKTCTLIARRWNRAASQSQPSTASIVDRG